MKKLSFLLFAFCISVAGWAQNADNNWNKPNPFAYDLRSSVDIASNTLTLQYTLNADAYTTQQVIDANTGRKNPIGLQIYLLDENGARLRKQNGSIWAITSGAYTKGTHSVTLPLSDFPSAYQGQKLSWEVVVHGNPFRTTPKEVYNYNAINTYGGWYPKNVHGIAIEKNPDHPHFGRIYITEACTTSTPGKNSLLEYDMELKYKGYHHKDYLVHSDGEKTSSHFSASVNYEPHRVKISEDGRLFVTCYHPTASHAVLEYLGNHTYKSIIKCKGENTSAGGNIDDNNEAPSAYNYGPDPKYNRRPIAMDVRGSGPDLKVLVAWIKPKGFYPTSNVGNWRSRVEIIEYHVGENGCDIMQDAGTTVAIWNDKATSDDNAGWVFQTYFGKYENNKFIGTYDPATHGFIDISYDQDGDIWLKVDYAHNKSWPGEIYLFKRETNDTKKEYDYCYTFVNNGTTCYGANGIGIIKNKNGAFELFTGSATNTLAKFTINKNTSPEISSITTYTQNGEGSNRIVGIADDYAGNVYLLNNRGHQDNNDNVVVFAMPYDGSRTTRAQEAFSVQAPAPVPNIYATNLRYEPVKGAAKYKFSFNVNTTPNYAEIRFYKSYESMKQSLEVVNADNFSGNESTRLNDANLVCYYPITSGLKQGKIEVELGMVGGVINQQSKQLTNACLPRGELYWSVYVETDRSEVFAPIYRQGTIGKDEHYRLHATVNNYPETDQFGAIYAVQEDKRTGKEYSSLMVYEVDDMNNDDCSLNNKTRYQKTHEYRYAAGSNPDKAAPRRMTVAPDGLVYIAHQGDENQNASTVVANWKYGGIYMWNPNDSIDANGKIKLSLFSNNEIGTSTAVVLYPLVNGNDTTWKLYATNTYNEYSTHGDAYTKELAADINSFGWNGFVEYVKNKNLNWTAWNNINTPTNKYKLGRGDESGNISLATTDNGMWICQYRDHNVTIKENILEPYADNIGAYVLSFVPYGSYSSEDTYGPRTWRSCTNDGGRSVVNSTVTLKPEEKPSNNSQTKNAPLQSTPGGGMTYKKVKVSATEYDEYLYVVNHDGNILQWKMEWESGVPRMYLDDRLKILHTPTDTKGVLKVQPSASKPGTATDWTTAAITSMCFDFAGNLVTTTGVSYFDMNQLQNEASELAPEGGQNIIIYTMPYDRTNAREIQAPKSNIRIAERVSYLEENTNMGQIIAPYVNHATPCYVDIYRPMPNTSFSTFCLPFNLDIKQLTATEEYYGAEFKQFTGAEIVTVSNEKILELQFSDIPIEDGKQFLLANTPYIVKPKNRIPSIVKLQQPIQFVEIAEKTVGAFRFANNDNNPTTHNTISFTGVIPTKVISAENVLLLVAENRLAEMVPDDLNTNTGKIHGFRGYFTLGAPLPQGVQAIISNKDKTLTGLIDVNGKKVNIQKYLREGRVFIRVEDKLYTLDGQKVE